MLAPVVIYVFLPIIGTVSYWALAQWMRRKGVPSPPELAFVVLFFTWGGFLQVVLTAWFWEWSGMASIGVLYLILVAPFLTAYMAWHLRRLRDLSAFHRCAFLLSCTYSCLIAVGLPAAIYTQHV